MSCCALVQARRTSSSATLPTAKQTRLIGRLLVNTCLTILLQRSHNINQNSDPKSALGSLVYTAPEEIMVQSHSDERASDVWSIGVLLYIMLTGTYPFGQLAAVYDQKQVQEMLSRIMEAKYEVPDASPEAVSLLQQMLTREASQRATLDDVCKNEWLTEVWGMYVCAAMD